ncbi:flagellar assembly peptidoglycan hydrolase FlgJ [Pseudoxanthomonas sp.]|uniref:flagellar assembly peptidoglycan hydrolase FlgJ n=1 Tax=Pseudoxanthomonas sp. TaxID=1871049 RepID=UPI0031F31E02
MPLGTTSGLPPQKSRIDDVSRKLESQFTQMLVKCMREASFGDSLFPQENQVYHDLYDRQLSDLLSQGKGLGLASQISRQLGAEQAASDATGTPVMLTPVRDSSRSGDAGAQANATDPSACDEVGRIAASDPSKFPAGTPEHFVAKIWPHARRAAQELGVDPRALVAQAALETGWGRRGIRDDRGNSANNLFGIKASGWQGSRVNTATHEYVDGQRRSERADFRAYDSAAESFADYVRLLKSNPRYQHALQAGSDVKRFASELQRAGYATDPGYARKIHAIANGPTLERALAVDTPRDLLASR